jgi:hypothetical protein
MTQQVINTGAVANDGTGESLRNAFDAVNNNFANIWTAGPVDSQVIISNNRISTTVQNLALVLAGNGVGTITVDSTVVPGIDSVYDLGTANSQFDSVYSRYFYGNGAFLSGISNGSGSATSVTFAATPPLAANIGDIWIQSDTGIQYLYFNDNTSNQWAEMEAYQSFSSGGTGNGNVDLTNVSSDIIPSNNNSYSLGNSVRQWKDLWVSNSTIYLNSLPITADGANLKVNGNTVLTTSSPLSFSNLSVTGNVSANAVYTNNYFYANGAPFPQGSNSLPGTTISLKDNVIATTTLNQNLVLSANGVGNLQTNSSIMPDATQVRDIGSASNKFNSIYAGYYYGNGSQLTGINAGNSNSIISGNSNVKIVTAGGNVTIGIGGIGNIVVVSGAGAYVAGVVSASGNITGNYFIGNGSQLTGLPATYGNANVVANLAALGSNPVSTTGNVTGGNLLTGAQVVASGVIQTGTGFSTGGYLSVDGDTDLHKTTVTGNLSATGNITANVGSFFIGNGSQLTGIVSSYGNSNVVANLAALGSNPVSTTGNITGGNLTTAGIANVATLAVTGSATVQGSISIFDSSTSLSATGNVIGGNVKTVGLISATGNVTGNYFIGNGSQLTGLAAAANTGNVTFSGEAVIGTGTSNTVSGLYLAPDPGSLANNLYLRVRGNILDEATHIHFDTGNNQYYNQFIGDDNKYIQLANTGNIVINTNNYVGNTAQWNFDYNGVLTVPASNSVPGQISTQTTTQNESGFDLRITAGNTGGCTQPGGDLFLSAGVGYNGVSHGAGNVNIVTGDRYGNITGNIWNFGADGVLTLPLGSATIKNTAGNAVAFGLNAGLTSQGNSAVAIGINSGVYSQSANAVAVGTLAGNGGRVTTNYVSGAVSPSTTLVVVSTTGIVPGMVITGTGFFGTITVVTVTNSTTLEISASAGFTPSGALNFTGSQGDNSVAIGTQAGQVQQGQFAVAIGDNAGNKAQGTDAVAIGASAGLNTQGAGAVAFGQGTGETSQGANAVALGKAAGQVNQGINSIAIGRSAGVADQGNNSIILNATGAVLDQTTANTFTVAPVRNDVANVAQVMFYNTTSKEITYGNVISVAGNVTGNYFIGNGSQLTGIVSSYGNANVVANLAALGSNPVSTTGNISGNYFIGNGSQLSSVATQVTGSWTLAAGTNTVSLTVPGPGTYSIWVNGNIPNGIVTYTATIVVTNTNVPVVGSSYGWYYAAGNQLVLTAIPNQIVGTLNNISTATVVTTTANVFTFGITNNSGSSQVVNYGYTKL